MKIAIHTSLDDLEEIKSSLSKMGDLLIPKDFSQESCYEASINADVIFTNPNNLGFKYDKKILSKLSKLKYFVTASTGTDHIDLDFLKQANIKLFCLRNDTQFMSQVTATAEHAMCLTLASARKLQNAFDNIKNNKWSWQNCVGVQISSKNVGVVGYGRLGKLYAFYMAPMAKEILVYDPNLKKDDFKPFKSVDIKSVMQCDILSIHIHADHENLNWLDEEKLSYAKSDIIIINTSRGGVVNENELADFLKKNVDANYATDVLFNELDNFRTSPLLDYELSKQVMITPHIGGMTKQSRLLAYARVIDLFSKELDHS